MPQLFAVGLVGLVLALFLTLGRPGRWVEERLWQHERRRHRQEEP